MNKYLIVFTFVLSSCAIFHKDFDSANSASTGFKKAILNISIVRVSNGKEEFVKMSEDELKSLSDTFSKQGISFSDKNYDYELVIKHTGGNGTPVWRTLSFFTLGIIPYWEKSQHKATLLKKDSRPIGQYSIDSTSVISLFIIPAQIYKVLKGSNGLNSVRKELVKEAIKDIN